MASLKSLRRIIGEQTPGSWIAISLNRKSVVGLGISPEEAKLIAKAEGEAGVILLRIPDRNILRFVVIQGEAMQHKEIRGEIQDFLDSLRMSASTSRVCKRCGFTITTIDATFSLWSNDCSWTVPLPVCPKCDFTPEMLKFASPKVA
jgi:hypothetical protein